MLRLITLILLITPAFAGLGRSDKKEVKKLLDGTFYARIDMPCATGRHAYGTYKRPLVEVSPEGVNTEAENVISASWYHADSTYWGVSVNEGLRVEEFDIEDDGIEIELESIDDDDIQTVIMLVDIHNIDDFKKGLELAFSRVPLQDEHDDWSRDIKDAIAERRLVNGMSKKQAYCVTGRPVSFQKSEQGGKSVETWNLRTDKGVKMGYFTTKVNESTGLPSQIKFVDGSLVNHKSMGSSSDFSLDD